MINPTQITDFNRSRAQLQAFWTFCIVVAGKNSDYAASVVAKLLNKGKDDPFGYFRSLGEHGIRNALVAAKAGQYDRISRAIRESLDLDLETCTFDELMAVFGVGPKTAQFFLVHSRPNYEGVVLDTHILRYLRDKNFDAPESTPQKMEKYNELSKAFLYISAMDFPNLSAAQRDLLIWRKYSGRE